MCVPFVGHLIGDASHVPMVHDVVFPGSGGHTFAKSPTCRPLCGCCLFCLDLLPHSFAFATLFAFICITENVIHQRTVNIVAGIVV